VATSSTGMGNFNRDEGQHYFLLTYQVTNYRLLISQLLQSYSIDFLLSDINLYWMQFVFKDFNYKTGEIMLNEWET